MSTFILKATPIFGCSFLCCALFYINFTFYSSLANIFSLHLRCRYKNEEGEKMSRVLIILSEDLELINQVEHAFKREGYTVWVVETEKSLSFLTLTVEPTHIVIDNDWFYRSADLCVRLRRSHFEGCLIVLVSESMKLDGMLALELGADDYLVKPFDLRELLIRIRAVERRGDFHFQRDRNNMLKLGSLSLHVDSQTAYVGDVPVELTEKETLLLYALLIHPEKIFTRDMLIKHVMSRAAESDVRIIDVFVSRLRYKLKEAGTMIETVRNQGYRLKGKSDDQPSSS